MYKIKSKLSINEFNKLKLYHDSMHLMPAAPRVHTGFGLEFGLEYRIDDVYYYIPEDKTFVYEILNEKQQLAHIRKLKLEKIEPNYGRLDE